MASFIDKQNDSWDLRIDFNSIRHVKRITGINLLKIQEPLEGSDATVEHEGQTIRMPLFTELATDPLLLCEVILALLKGQMEARSLSEDDLASRFVGGVMAESRKAFWESLIYFFREESQTDSAQVLIANQELMKHAMRFKTNQIEALKIEELVDTEFSKLSMNGQESSESIPDHIPSES